jgi:hypothetical protein
LLVKILSHSPRELNLIGRDMHCSIVYARTKTQTSDSSIRILSYFLFWGKKINLKFKQLIIKLGTKKKQLIIKM